MTGLHSKAPSSLRRNSASSASSSIIARWLKDEKIQA